MEYILLALVAFWAGYRVSTWIHVQSFKGVLEQLNVSANDLKRVARENGIQLPDEDDDDAPTKTTVNIKVETHQGTYYAFELEKDTFIAQGTTTDELLDRILAKYPTGVNVNCDVDHGGEMLIDAVERMKEKRNG